MIIVEAETASLLNGLGREIEYIDLGSLGKIESSGLLKTEPFTKGDDSGTCVANFKSAGDMIVFQVNASAAIENARIDVRAIYSALSGTFDASEHEIFYVNGTDANSLVTLTGTLDNTAYDEITATGVSLQKGANYIILTCTSAEASSLGFMNVDKITISWDYEIDEETNEKVVTTVSEIVSGGSEVFKTESATAAEDGYALSIEAEAAGLFNSTSSSMGSTTILGTEQTTLTDDQGTQTEITNVKNFNTAGDKIVFQVYAEEDIEEATISITAANGATFGGTFADNDKILTVNGEAVSLEGTLTNAAFDWSTYGTLTGTISLTKGINYIVITAATTSSYGYLNVGKIDNFRLSNGIVCKASLISYGHYRGYCFNF